METAMGAAVGVFEGAQGIEVGRERFAPVKTTNDLLVLRSDCYEITDQWRVVLAGGRDAQPGVDLDPERYKLLDEFEAPLPRRPAVAGAGRAAGGAGRRELRRGRGGHRGGRGGRPGRDPFRRAAALSPP